MSDEWDEKAREIVSCPEVPDGTTHDRFCPFGWNNCRRSASCEMREDLAAAMRAIDTAAERRGIERAARWHDGEMARCIREALAMGSTKDQEHFERKADEHQRCAGALRALAQPAGASDKEGT